MIKENPDGMDLNELVVEECIKRQALNNRNRNRKPSATLRPAFAHLRKRAKIDVTLVGLAQKRTFRVGFDKVYV